MLLVKGHQREMERVGVREYLDFLGAAITLLSALIVWVAWGANISIHTRYPAWYIWISTSVISWSYLSLGHFSSGKTGNEFIKLRTWDGEAGRVPTDGVCTFTWIVYAGGICHSPFSISWCHTELDNSTALFETVVSKTQPFVLVTSWVPFFQKDL